MKKKAIDKMIGDLESMIAQIEEALDPLNERMDNASEKWLESENCEKLQSKIDNLENTKGDLETALSSLQDIIEE